MPRARQPKCKCDITCAGCKLPYSRKRTRRVGTDISRALNIKGVF